VKIKLYIDNDSRPRGSYENVRTACHDGTLLSFTSSNLNIYVTNLRFCMQIEDGDKSHYSTEGHFIVDGRTKIDKKKAAKAAQKPMFPEDKGF
jgi:hypothetical protein